MAAKGKYAHCEHKHTPRKKYEDPKALQYIQMRLLHPDWSKRHCAEAVGFAGIHKLKNPGAYIEKRNPVTMMTMEQQRQNAILATGFSLYHAVGQLKNVADKSELDNAKVSAIKVAGDFLGFKAPEQREVKVQGLFVELKNYSNEELLQLQELLEKEKASA